MTTVSDVHDRAPRSGYIATGRRDSRRLLRAAKRHSRLVRVLRVLVPTLAVGVAIGGIAVATWLDLLAALTKLPVNIGGVVVSGTKITMRQPRMAGFTRDSRPYVVTARTAAQDVTNPDLLELEDIHATMESRDRGAFEVTARTGFYKTKAEQLTLQHDIVVSSSTYRGFLLEAVIDVRTGHVVSEEPVEITMLQGKINANRLEVFNSGEILRFEKGVVMNVVAESPQPARRVDLE